MKSRLLPGVRGPARSPRFLTLSLALLRPHRPVTVSGTRPPAAPPARSRSLSCGASRLRSLQAPLRGHRLRGLPWPLGANAAVFWVSLLLSRPASCRPRHRWQCSLLSVRLLQGACPPCSRRHPQPPRQRLPGGALNKHCPVTELMGLMSLCSPGKAFPDRATADPQLLETGLGQGARLLYDSARQRGNQPGEGMEADNQLSIPMKTVTDGVYGSWRGDADRQRSHPGGAEGCQSGKL